MDKPIMNLLRAAEVEAHSQDFSHPWNPASELHGAALSRMTGLKRTGVSRATLPPGKESFVYHSHALEEEWLYILAGRGVATIDGTDVEVGPGDFMGFPAPSVAHTLRNPFDQPLVYLMGGESREAEIADFPTLNRRTVRIGKKVEVYPLDAGVSFEFSGR